MHWLHEMAMWYLGHVERIGWGPFVFLGMLIESSFIPFPSEIVMPPAGHQAGSIGRLIWLIVLGTAGSTLGGLFNYWLGRPFFEKYGRYILVGPKAMAKMDRFWDRYGEAGTFIGRFVPAIRQLISVPAGISRMNIYKFTFFTALGSGIWVTVLAVIGWSFRSMSMVDFIRYSDQMLKHQMLPWTVAAIVAMIAAYVGWVKWQRRGMTRRAE